MSFDRGEWEARTAERNAALWPKRPDMRASLARGIAQAEAGEVEDLGTFTQQAQPKPAYYCGATIYGPPLIVNGSAARNVRQWIKQCRQRVKGPGERCRFHDDSGTVVGE